MVSLLKTKRGGALPAGSKFITPVVCFPTTINPLLQNGYKPVFVDVTLPNLNLDLDQVDSVPQPFQVDTAPVNIQYSLQSYHHS